jgi:predicted nucleotidyltransferase
MAPNNDQERIEEIVKAFGEIIKEKIKVRHLYLYGSYAQGTYSLESDIDVAVVADNFSGDPIEDTLLLMKLRRKIDYRIEPRPFKTEDFNLSNPLAKKLNKSSTIFYFSSFCFTSCLSSVYACVCFF